ncbi:MAG: TIGR03032 family protein [Limnobacter sp.]|uniref:TIGR03032 family protein n=1 Tax=Limnobacter sp. TaxID=2003368 RepID=UPI003918DAFD
MSRNLTRRLRELGVSICFSSYQSGLLHTVGSGPDGISQVQHCAVRKPMGLHYSPGDGLFVACSDHILRFADVLRRGELANEIFDACFLPRTTHHTGNLDAHDLSLAADGTPMFVNTRYNCLSRLSTIHSFEVVWKPTFITAIVPEDRCHLNGLAMLDGAPAYVTAVSRSNVIDGWRDRRQGGGVVIDVRNNQIVCEGLSMPHSPRIHNGTLWLLNAGKGELGYVDHAPGLPGRFVPKAFCPGFLRGLVLVKNYAFVGLSKPRYQRFEGLELDNRLKEADSEAWCGVQVIDINTGVCVDWLRIDGGVTELYDVIAIPDKQCPFIRSPTTMGDDPVVTFER